MSFGALPGFRDFYPAELADRAHIFRAWREVARRYAFVEYDGPPLESLELYTRKSGDEIVGQLYAFEDKGGRQVALRPEMTPTVARMVAARANALRKPVRWFSVPQLFRYERQQKGRLREHFQLNVDIFGEDNSSADAELLAVAIDVMRELGLSSAEVKARVSDRRLLNAVLDAIGVTAEQRGAVYAVIDKLDRQPGDVSLAKLAEAGLNEHQAADVLALPALTELQSVRDKFGDRSPLIHEITSNFDTYFSFLDALGVRAWVVLDLSIVRGLAYYTGIVCELFDASGEFRAICGGGRYDELLKAVGGPAMPALGFGMGDVVLGELLKARKRMPDSASHIDYWIASEDGSVSIPVIELVTDCRRLGRSVEYALRAQSPGKQYKAAVAAGACALVVLQHDGRVLVRALDDSRSERDVLRHEFLDSA